jgi:hypothetical protein
MVNRAMNFLRYGGRQRKRRFVREQLPRLENWGVPPDSVEVIATEAQTGL